MVWTERLESGGRSTPEVRSLGDSPGASAVWLSVFVHLVAIGLIIVVRHAGPTRISTKYQSAQLIRGTAHLALPPKSTPSRIRPVRVKQLPRQAQPPQQESAADGAQGQGLREQAQRETADMVMSFKFRAIYGFYPGHKYQLAVQTSGEIPSISAAQVPPHFQQYVIVEVTIDAEGQVAEARIVTGLVDTAIEQTLLSAIREFRYTPATRDGLPIPSQLDIVIHIPS